MVTREEQDTILRHNTAIFVNSFRQVLKDMVNADFSVSSKPVGIIPAPPNSMVVISHFSGMIQGDFLIATDEVTAARAAGVYVQGASYAALIAQREIYAGFLCEAMNVCSHHSIEDLEEMFGALTILPPSWIFGEYHSADYISGIGFLEGGYGGIYCSLSLNLISLQVINDLQNAGSSRIPK